MRTGTVRALGAVWLASCLAAVPLGCKAYTGVVQKELIEEERVQEKVVRDDLEASGVHLPAPGEPHLGLAITWNLAKEYRIRKKFRIFREYYPFDASRELLEVPSAPFLLITALPFSLLMAPVELIAGGGGEEGDSYVFTKMFTLPFEFLHPGWNANRWVDRKNVYGKEPEMEDAGLETADPGPVQTEERSTPAAGAEVVLVVPEAEAEFKLQADEEGRVVFPIEVDLAALSQAGQGITLQLVATFEERTLRAEYAIPPEILERIYETLRLD